MTTTWSWREMECTILHLGFFFFGGDCGCLSLRDWILVTESINRLDRLRTKLVSFRSNDFHRYTTRWYVFYVISTKNSFPARDENRQRAKQFFSLRKVHVALVPKPKWVRIDSHSSTARHTSPHPSSLVVVVAASLETGHQAAARHSPPSCSITTKTQDLTTSLNQIQQYVL